MGLKIVWTRRAVGNYRKILEYIIKNFGNRSGDSYNSHVQEVIELISNYPEIGTKQNNKLRAIIIFKRTTVSTQ